MLFIFVFHLYKVLQSFIDVFGKIYGWRAKLSHGNCYQFVQTHFYQIIKQFIAPLKMECSMNYIAVTQTAAQRCGANAIWEKVYTIGGLFLLLFHARLFF